MASGVLCSFLVRFRPPRFFAALDIVLVLYAVLNLRRAFLLSATSLSYRPAIGALVAVTFQEIVSVKKTVATTGIKPGPAIRITIAGGIPLVFPLPVEADEFVACLEKLSPPHELP